MEATAVNPEVQEIFDTVKKKYGFVPNLIQEMAISVSTAQTYLQGQNALASGALTPAEQQAVQLTVSSLNQCHYCQAAHRFVGGMTGIAAEDIAAIQSGNMPNNQTLSAAVKTTRLLMTKQGRLSADEIKQLETQGISKPKLYEIIAYIGLKTITNFINHIAQTPVDVQFSGKDTTSG